MVLSSSYARAYYDPGNGPEATRHTTSYGSLSLRCSGSAACYWRLNFRWALQALRATFCCVTLVLLMLVPFIGVKANGARRWLGVGGLTVQPSELAKLAVILVLRGSSAASAGKDAHGALWAAAVRRDFHRHRRAARLEPHSPHRSSSLPSARSCCFSEGELCVVCGSFRRGRRGTCRAADLLPLRFDAHQHVARPVCRYSDGGYQIVQSLYSIGSAAG